MPDHDRRLVRRFRYWLLAPLNTKRTWRLRLRLWTMMDPAWFRAKWRWTGEHYELTNPTGSLMKSKKKPPMPGKGGKKPC